MRNLTFWEKVTDFFGITDVKGFLTMLEESTSVSVVVNVAAAAVTEVILSRRRSVRSDIQDEVINKIKKIGFDPENNEDDLLTYSSLLWYENKMIVKPFRVARIKEYLAGELERMTDVTRWVELARLLPSGCGDQLVISKLMELATEFDHWRDLSRISIDGSEDQKIALGKMVELCPDGIEAYLLYKFLYEKDPEDGRLPDIMEKALNDELKELSMTELFLLILDLPVESPLGEAIWNIAMPS